VPLLWRLQAVLTRYNAESGQVEELLPLGLDDALQGCEASVKLHLFLFLEVILLLFQR
jgi:hypothetical protein